jgi:Domain of unknown function (DUF4167)
LRLGDSHPIYALRVMRGADPAVTRKGWRPPYYIRRPSLLVSAFVVESRGARNIGDSMLNNLRRWPRERPLVQRPSNGGNAPQQYERYLARAREAQVAGDSVEVENCYQHAEHYFRVMRGEGHEHRGHL